MGLCASTSTVGPEPPPSTSSLPSSPNSTRSLDSRNETRPPLTAVSPIGNTVGRPPNVDTSNLMSPDSPGYVDSSIRSITSTRTPSTPHKRSTVRKQRWKKGDMIGAGSYGRVFMGLNMDTGSLIAIKELVFSPDNQKEVAAMQQEINLMKSLDHPNIVKYLGTEMGSETNSNLLYIFTEWVPGGSLQSLLSKFGKFDEQVTKKYAFQILQGLQFLHVNRVVHRDIKGANILIDDKGTVKLADFGASKRLTGTLATLQDDNMSLRGTPYFMAPEVITQTGHGRKADVWSVGCTVLQMATGMPPWKTMKFGSISALMYHVANTNDPPPMPNDISESLRSFLHMCFQRNPQQRPSADELLQHSFVSSVAADFADMTMGNMSDAVDLSQVLDQSRAKSRGEGGSEGRSSSFNGGNNIDGINTEGTSLDAIPFDERGPMGTNDVLGTLSLTSDATLDNVGQPSPGGPRAQEPFDITSFSLIPNSPAPEASIREYLSARGRETETMGSDIRESPSTNPFSRANVDGVPPEASMMSNNDQSLNSSSGDNNPQEHSLTIEEQEEQRIRHETYLREQERPLTTDHAVRNAQELMAREERVKTIKAEKEAAWQKELADELAMQTMQRSMKPL